MLYSVKVVGIPDIENAIRRKIWFPVIGRDSETYGNILDYLISRCNPETWTMTLTHELIGESEVESLPPIRERYRPYRIRTEVFQGAADRHAVTTITDICRCTPEAIDLFRGYANFFAIEDEIDVALYDGDTCLLRTINHERNLNLNPIFFQDLTSVIESEKHLGEGYFNDYAYCTGNALPYGLDVTDREIYDTVFLKIFPYCDTFSLIRRGGEAQKTENDLSRWKIADGINLEEAEQWPTEEYRKNVVDVTTYSCCKESIEDLLQSLELCKLEMIFSCKKLCIAYTIPARKKIVLDVFYFFWEHRLILDPNPPGES